MRAKSCLISLVFLIVLMLGSSVPGTNNVSVLNYRIIEVCSTAATYTEYESIVITSDSDFVAQGWSGY